jgi:hypothetical protein
MASSMFRGTCYEDTFPIKTFAASNMLWAEIKFSMEYLAFCPSVYGEYQFGGIP